ncbi:hypothetical protein BCIN_02g06050 [Botrytis cinerea B05.10]|uniref:RINT-1 family protein n=2 Tax=Botryotinia fuckeliana TaxID=40559 RepID=A0A384J9U2_BOTFB|nr:hypothetical protein BCIN_02g06050 [Botrytis cinerea B05.10]ATZ47313.1 hypothetical protein BCIN_02g06050 [Botrytis cinerea B05.10]CCD55745.1 similar to RINT-1 family protein [Botrytis cinerea T4]
MSLHIEQERSPRAYLCNPVDDIPVGERNIRVEDWLNDKVQTTADMTDLSSLLENVEAKQRQLEEQLKDAKTKLAEAKISAANHTSSMTQKNQAFEQQQEDLRARMMILTSSDTPEEAVQRLKGPMEKLQQVEVAQAYVELLKDVDDLTKEAHQNLPDNPTEALKPYVRLKQLAMTLQATQNSTEIAAPHLVSYVEQTSIHLWTQMVQIMVKEFQDVLKALNWPNLAVEVSKEWQICFGRLLDLQAPEIREAREPLVLLPFAVLVKESELKFRYHFMGTTPTSASSVLGEYYLHWIISVVDSHETYLRDNAGPVLAAHFLGSSLAGNSLYIDPVSAFITALLPLVKEKTDLVLNEVQHNSAHLSKFIGQLMVWDDAIRIKYKYDGGNAEVGWVGVTWHVLDKWFSPWLEAQERFAFQRYEEIMESPDNGDIDYDSNESKKTKGTFGATKVTDLLKTITTQYKDLRKVSHKLRFFLNTQIAILDRYQIRLSESLDAYISLTSTVGRIATGATKEQQRSVEGMAGLVSLCKVFGSADHIISTLEFFSNEAFFVELYFQLDERAQGVHPDSAIAGPITCSQLKLSTSLKLGTGEGTIFDTTIQSFKKIRSNAGDLLQRAIRYPFPTAFRAYLTQAQWTTVGQDSQSLPHYTSSLTISAELDQPLQVMKEKMAYLEKTISYPAFMRIWRQAISALEDLLFNEVLLRQDFTTLGAARFSQDLKGIQTIIGNYLPSEGTAFMMPRLTQGIALLNLPIEAPDEGGMSLSEAAEKIYAGRNECEGVLRRLHMDLLDNPSARQIILRRVEAND